MTFFIFVFSELNSPPGALIYHAKTKTLTKNTFDTVPLSMSGPIADDSV